MMKKLFTLLLAAACFTATAQTEYPYPWNPDGNNDGFVSMNDLLDLLAIFGSEYYSGVLATDSISAIMYTGQLDYWDCTSSCVALAGNWKVLDHYLVGSYKSEIVEGSAQSWWLDHRVFEGNDDSQFFRLTHYGDTTELRIEGSHPFSQGHCYCQTRTRGDIEDLNLCENELDECGVCGGDGAVYDCGCESIPEGECDCDGNQVDAVGVCGGDCLEDLDGDGVCDPVLGPCEGEDFVSYHGVDYPIVETADGRCWFAADLNSDSYNDGTLLSSVWYTDSYQYLEINPPAFITEQGQFLYNGGTIAYTDGGAQETKNICPNGWHVPSLIEWQYLTNSYSSDYSTFLSLWSEDDACCGYSLFVSLGSSGLNLAGTNFAEQNSLYTVTESHAKYWTSTPFNGNSETFLYRSHISPNDWLNQNWTQRESARVGLPIRCIKD